jgi:hypothetical protein
MYLTNIFVHAHKKDTCKSMTFGALLRTGKISALLGMNWELN